MDIVRVIYVSAAVCLVCAGVFEAVLWWIRDRRFKSHLAYPE